MITNWQIPTSVKERVFIDSVESKLISFPFSEQMPMNFYSVLWFKAKYSDGIALVEFLKRFQNLWNGNDLLRRQAVISLTRLWNVDHKFVTKILDAQIASNISGTISVASCIRMFAEAKSLEGKINMYLFNRQASGAFPLQKFLVLCSFMNSGSVKNNSETWRKISHFVKDPYYLKILTDTYK